MQVAEHGNYRLACSNRIIEIVAIGSWNEATIQHLFEQLNELIDSFNGAPFATLVDIRGFALGTPEFKQITIDGTELIVERGLVSDAYVLGASSLSENMVRDMSPKKINDQYERQFFYSHLEALAWLHRRGFSIY